MTRLWIWAPVACLVLVSGYLGYRYGAAHAELTESVVIERFAERYVAETGGAPTDCVAYPGAGRVWLVISCGFGQQTRLWHVDRRGQIVEAEGREA